MRIDDGFSTKISFVNFPSVQFWEKTVTPPGVDGGGPNDTTTMRNTAFRTLAPKKLKSMTEASTTVAYDPAAYNDIWSMVNVNQSIIVTFPDLSTLQFWGWLNTFEPGENTEGEQPTADVNIQCSNQNTAGAETAPVFTAAP